MVLLPLTLLPSRVMDQPNRFTVRVEPAEGGSNLAVSAYLSNTGNLRAILHPSAHVLSTPVQHAGRKLPFEIVLARQWGCWVAVDAMLSSRLLGEAIDAGTLAAFAGWRVERREPVLAGGRLDLLLRRGDRRLWLEAKCTTLVRNGVARFPLPATERGRRHLEHLVALRQAGVEAAVCFVAQRGDARAFRTLVDVDPAFTSTLAAARAVGVRCHAYRCRVTRDEVRIGDEIPVLDSQ